MQLSVKGKQLDVGDSLKAHVLSSLENTVDKYFDNALEGVVHFSREGQSFRADISVHVGHNILIQSHSLAADPYGAFDSAGERVATQLRRYKRRLRDHHKGRSPRESVAAQQYILAPESEEKTEDEVPAQTRGKTQPRSGLQTFRPWRAEIFDCCGREASSTTWPSGFS